MTKQERVMSYLIDEVSIKDHAAIARIPMSVVFAWITMFVERNEHLRLTRTWFDPSDEWNTLLGVCEDCLPHKDAHLTVSEEPELSFCYKCNTREDHERRVIGASYNQAIIEPVKPEAIVREIDKQWANGNGFIEDIHNSDDWKEIQEMKSSARREFCVFVEEEYGYAYYLWWPDFTTPDEVQEWFRKQKWVHMSTLREWGRVKTVDNFYHDILRDIGLPLMHVHEPEDQYFHVPA